MAGMARASILLLLLSVITCTADKADKYGMKLRVTKKGLDHVSAVAQAVIQKKLKELKIPDLSEQNDPISWNITNIQITVVSNPISGISPNVGSQDLIITLTGLAVRLTGHISARYKQKWLVIPLQSGVEANIADTSLTVTTGLGNKAGRPSLNLKSCSARLGSLSLTFNNSIAQQIIKKVKTLADHIIKSKLEEKVCELVEKFISEKAASLLDQLRMNFEIDNKILVDYSLVASPIITSDSIETRHKGEAYWKADIVESSLTPNLIPEWSDNERMLDLAVTEYSADTLANVAHTYGYLQYNLTPSTINRDDVAVLNISCPSTSTCAGSFIPQLKEKYSNSWVEAYAKTAAVPEVTVTSKHLTIGLVCIVDIFVCSPDNNKILAFKLQANISLDIKPRIEDDKLKGEIKNFSFRLGLVQSTLERAAQLVKELERVLNFFLRLKVIPKMNKYGNDGLNLMFPNNMKLTNVRLTLREGGIMASTDVDFQV